MKPANRDGILLRMVAFRLGDRWGMICLDTNIAVVADTQDDLHRKMKDATVLYLKSFNKQELEAGTYRRTAPLRYLLKWHFYDYLARVTHMLKSATIATYDPHSSGVSFA